VHLADLPTPALLVDGPALAHNIATMAAARPGPELRPHVKAFKSTAIARELVAAGHDNFCCATVREVEVMAAAGLGADLLLANEVLDADRLGAVADRGARVTVAVDSEETITAAALGGVREVLIDVNVGLPRCGCRPGDAASLAEMARATGLEVRGVMGYEGHLMDWTDRAAQAAEVEKSMAQLVAAHADVGGDVVSGGGTGTYDVNHWVTELQAGSYTLMDSHYARLGLPFRQALYLLTTVISVHPDGWLVTNGGLKSLAMDHGNPSIAGERGDRGEVFFCSDEHTTITGRPGAAVGQHVWLVPAHVDPTVAKHEMLHVVDGERVVDHWPIDMRHW
jgi:D-serine deaminase-like pyridoxal phosphate-dependent protein